MEWYWIIILILILLVAILFFLGYLFFLYMCKPNRERSLSLDGAEGRALQSYVPKIKMYALQATKHPHETVSILSFDNLKLYANLYPNKLEKEFVILVHGYHSSSFWDFGASFEMYYNEGYTILALNNRAHGSEGKYIGFGVLDSIDVESWINWIIEKHGENCKIAIAGVSMGAATVMLTASRSNYIQLKCAIEDCGYSSLKGVVTEILKKKRVPVFPIFQIASLWCKLLAGYFFEDANPEKALSCNKVPTLFIHGTSDGFVPFYMLDKVYNACHSEKNKVIFEDAVHGESSYKFPNRYKDELIRFLSTYMK